MSAAGGERFYGRLDTDRDNLGAEQYQSAHDGPEEHLSRFGNFGRFAARSDEFESDEDHHENNDDRAYGVSDDFQDAQQKRIDTRTLAERIEEGDA